MRVLQLSSRNPPPTDISILHKQRVHCLQSEVVISLKHFEGIALARHKLLLSRKLHPHPNILQRFLPRPYQHHRHDSDD
jgi:hypothetical protein